MEEILGYEPGELTGRPIEDVVPDRLRQAHVHQREGFSAGGRVRHMGRGLVLLARCKDGTEKPVEIGLGGAGPSHQGVIVGFVTDIAERLRLADLERHDEEREARLQMLAETAVALGHHLRNSVMCLLGQAELCQDGDPRHIAGLRRTVLHEGQRVAAVVDALLELAQRSEAPGSHLPFHGAEPMIDIDALVEQHWQRRMAEQGD
jgi:PAS domain S-box-containing protein